MNYLLFLAHKFPGISKEEHWTASVNNSAVKAVVKAKLSQYSNDFEVGTERHFQYPNKTGHHQSVLSSCTYDKKFLLINSLVSVSVKHVERNAEARLRLCNNVFTPLLSTGYFKHWLTISVSARCKGAIRCAYTREVAWKSWLTRCIFTRWQVIQVLENDLKLAQLV